jgi:hypothetical protein
MLLRPLLVAAALTAVVAAQSPEKVAQKTFKADAKALAKQHKALLKADMAALEPDLDDFFAEVKAGNVGEAAVQDLFDALQELQAAVIIDTRNTCLHIAEAALAALDDIGGVGEDLGGVYPQGFHSGDGGTFDDAEDAVAKNLAAAYAGLAKKLAKLPPLAAKHGAGFTVRVLPPQAPTEVCANETTLSYGELPLTIDVALGTSDPSVAGDGAVWLAGTEGTILQDVTLDVYGDQGFLIEQKTVVVDDDTHRWGLKLDLDGAGYPAANYIVLAQVAGVGSRAAANVGVP